MLIVEWAPVAETEEMPPFGEELAAHIRAYKGGVRQASASAWTLLWRVLEKMNRPPGEAAFAETGKPYFKNEDLFFSISHSREVCAVAVADRPVGVDVEAVRDSYAEALVRRTLSDREQAAYDGDFTRLWCRKEALVKMTGEGIRRELSSVETGGHVFAEERIAYGDRNYWLVAVAD